MQEFKPTSFGGNVTMGDYVRDLVLEQVRGHRGRGLGHSRNTRVTAGANRCKAYVPLMQQGW
jgi:hypothetical protein